MIMIDEQLAIFSKLLNSWNLTHKCKVEFSSRDASWNDNPDSSVKKKEIQLLSSTKTITKSFQLTLTKLLNEVQDINPYQTQLSDHWSLDRLLLQPNIRHFDGCHNVKHQLKSQRIIIHFVPQNMKYSGSYIRFTSSVILSQSILGLHL